MIAQPFQVGVRDGRILMAQSAYSDGRGRAEFSRDRYFGMANKSSGTGNIDLVPHRVRHGTIHFEPSVISQGITKQCFSPTNRCSKDRRHFCNGSP